MQNLQKNTPLANNHISVDCVVIGFDGEQLKVLLVKRAGEDNGEVYHDMKLPGSLIYMDEALDEAAQRVLYELTGLKNVNLMQFKAFGSKNRTSNPKDVRWLERAMQSKVERIVTIAYLSMVKIDRTLDKNLDDHQACWVALKDVKTLAFDHNLIIKEAMTYIRQFVEFNPSMLFELLPRKFTAAQLRTLFELVYDKAVDVRNFHKSDLVQEHTPLYFSHEASLVCGQEQCCTRIPVLYLLHDRINAIAHCTLSSNADEIVRLLVPRRMAYILSPSPFCW